jgi:2-polyprenyl-3-methyl-5-hydroxy-6-metoxy-1,4-benzoquinol methylase
MRARILSSFYGLLTRLYPASPFCYNFIYRLARDPFTLAASSYEQKKQEDILKMVGSRRYQNALDIGCGCGISTSLLAPYCDRVQGVDFSEVAISLARKNTAQLSHLAFTVADIRKLNLWEKYDLVLCSEVLYYLKPLDLAFFVKNLEAWLKPGGWVIVVGWEGYSYVYRGLEKRLVLREYIKGEDLLRPYLISRYSLK